MATPARRKKKSGAKPFDVSLKNLIGSNPKDWLPLFKIPADTPITALDGDLASMSLAADRLYKVGVGDAAYGLHAELEAGHTGSELPKRLLQYSVFAEAKHRLVFKSVAVLLTKGANSPVITGTLERKLPDGSPILSFHYDVVRVYSIPAEQLLQSGLSVVPLAPLGESDEADLPRIVEAMGDRFRAEATDKEDLRRLWTASWLLMSARHTPALAESLLKGAVEAVLKLEDFPLYDYLQDKIREKVMAEGMTAGLRAGIAEGRQVGIAEGRQVGIAEGRQVGIAEGEQAGRLREARRMVVRGGARRLGAASPEVEARLERVVSLETLETLMDRVFDVETWDDLLAGVPQVP